MTRTVTDAMRTNPLRPTFQMLLSETKAIESDLRRTAVDRTIIMQNQADSYIRGESD